MPADADCGMGRSDLESRTLKRGVRLAPGRRGALRVHKPATGAADIHAGLRHEDGHLFDRDLELPDRNSFRDDHAPWQSFDVYAAEFVRGRAHHEFACRQHDHLWAGLAVLEVGLLLAQTVTWGSQRGAAKEKGCPPNRAGG